MKFAPSASPKLLKMNQDHPSKKAVYLTAILISIIFFPCELGSKYVISLAKWWCSYEPWWNKGAFLKGQLNSKQKCLTKMLLNLSEYRQHCTTAWCFLVSQVFSINLNLHSLTGTTVLSLNALHLIYQCSCKF